MTSELSISTHLFYLPMQRLHEKDPSINALMHISMPSLFDIVISGDLLILSPTANPLPSSTSSMGTKRSWEGQPVALHQKFDDKMSSTDTNSAFQSIFETFRDELDEHHDRRERIIKASRDITALSKKMYPPPPEIL